MKTSRVIFTLATFLSLAGAALAGEARHSGTVVAVRPDGFTLEVMGPWSGPGTEMERQEVRLEADTQVRLVKRVRDVEKAAWPVVFDATPLTVSALRTGDFVTVTRRDRATGVATVIDVIPPTD